MAQISLPNIPNVPNIPVPFSVVILVHFFFASHVQLSDLFYQWMPSYLFTHLVVILIALWVAYQKKGYEPIIAYIIAVAISMLNDIIMLGLYFEDTQDATDDQEHKIRDTWRYSAAAVIIHLLAKPLCILYALFAAFMRYNAGREGNPDDYHRPEESDDQQ
ncbi:type-1 angiotensin II receptor-associated protein-like [Dysidea avara]|uniref:type-1 angiotensin II receptor-associated protein-like n=1 Tax=Dysidea avara TaxID=196820 RepID=UPI0033185BA8